MKKLSKMYEFGVQSVEDFVEKHNDLVDAVVELQKEVWSLQYDLRASNKKLRSVESLQLSDRSVGVSEGIRQRG